MTPMLDTSWYNILLDDLQRLAFEGIVKTKHAIGKRIIEDELKFGKPEYGRRRIEGLAKDLQISRGELYRCIQFAKQYELSDISDNLSWYEIEHKLLPALKQQGSEITPLPKGKYNVIYADPPWKYSDKLIEGYGAAEHHYPTMSINELCEINVKGIAASDAVLFLWVTSPLLDECWPIIDAWGFEYKTSFVWDKVKHNYGHYNSVRHELLLVCTRGTYLPQTSKLYDSVQEIERTPKHSEKPEKFRKIIETMYPNSKRIELFARKKVHGWQPYGNECN